MPGLSSSRSLPCRIASTASGARSQQIAAEAISAMLASSMTARLSATRFACGKALRELGGEIVLDRVEGDELGAGAQQAVHLPVDMVVVQPNGREAQGAHGKSP